MAKLNQKPKTAPTQKPPAPPEGASNLPGGQQDAPGADDPSLQANGQPGAPGGAEADEDNEGHAKTVRVVPALRVTAKTPFRRAGIFFGALPRNIALSELTEEQIEQLKAEPMLTCVEIEVEAAAE